MRKVSFTTARGLARGSFLGFAVLVSHCLLAQPFFFSKDIRGGEMFSDVAAGDFKGDGKDDLMLSENISCSFYRATATA